MTNHNATNVQAAARIMALQGGADLLLADSETGYVRFDFTGRHDGAQLPEALTAQAVECWAFDGYDEDGFACWRAVA